MFPRRRIAQTCMLRHQRSLSIPFRKSILFYFILFYQLFLIEFFLFFPFLSFLFFCRLKRPNYLRIPERKSKFSFFYSFLPFLSASFHQNLLFFIFLFFFPPFICFSHSKYPFYFPISVYCHLLSLLTRDILETKTKSKEKLFSFPFSTSLTSRIWRYFTLANISKTKTKTKKEREKLLTTTIPSSPELLTVAPNHWSLLLSSCCPR